jgi:hypothetical protein
VSGGQSLAVVIAAALEEARQIDEERVRAIVKEELGRAGGAGREPVRSCWMTPPAAARFFGVGVKRIRALNGIERRLRNVNGENAKQRKYLVNVDEVAAALAAGSAKTVQVSNQKDRAGAEAWAEQVRSKSGNRR